MGKHRLRVTFSNDGCRAKLVCPDDGSCEAATQCSECGRSVDDTETKPCYDCPTEPCECWLKSWADNLDFVMEGMVHGEAEFEIASVQYDEGPVVTLAAPSMATDEKQGSA